MLNPALVAADSPRQKGGICTAGACNERPSESPQQGEARTVWQLPPHTGVRTPGFCLQLCCSFTVLPRAGHVTSPFPSLWNRG